MEDKTKIIGLVAIIVLVVAGVGIFLSKKSIPAVPVAQVQIAQIPTTAADKKESIAPAATTEKPSIVIEGKVRSMNEKQIFVELADGKGSAINITSTTPVVLEGENSIGNLSLLKPGAVVSVKIDNDINAIEILIKK